MEMIRQPLIQSLEENRRELLIRQRSRSYREPAVVRAELDRAAEKRARKSAKRVRELLPVKGD